MKPTPIANNFKNSQNFKYPNKKQTKRILNFLKTLSITF